MNGAPTLGRLLVTSGLLTQQALDEVLALQKTDPRRLGELLDETGVLRAHQLAQFLSHQLACPWISLQRVEIAREAVARLPREIALKHHMVPVHLRTSKDGQALYVAMDDPTDEVALAEATSAATMTVKPMVAITSEIRTLLDRFYGNGTATSMRPPESSPTPPAAYVSVRPSARPSLSAPRQTAKDDAIRGASTRPPKPPPPQSIAPPARKERSVLEDVEIIEDDGRPTIADGPRLYVNGTILDDRYELLRDLGGRVESSRWEARHLRTTRRSVVKIGFRAADPTDEEAVRREHMALRRLQHPGAVDLRDAGNATNGDPYIVVEMLEGRTLEGLVAARGALHPTEACALIRQIGEVLVAAHDAGVIHREVRPENVLVVRDAWGVERVKLTNWESAALAQEGAEAAVDLGGVGVCAFLAFVGRSRKEGEDLAGVELASELKGVIAGAMGGGNARRFSSVKDFVEALEAAAPRRRDSKELLHANPDRRGKSMSSPPAQPAEQRRFRRAAYRTPVRVEVPGIGSIDGRSEDISEGGLFVVTRVRIADGVEVTVRFALPIDGKVVSEAGVVRWSRGSPSGEGAEPRAIGIELSGSSADTVRQIARYVSFMAPDAAPA
jgi:hypothetical protein